jgi:hypothetical protein
MNRRMVEGTREALPLHREPQHYWARYINKDQIEMRELSIREVPGRDQG